MVKYNKATLNGEFIGGKSGLNGYFVRVAEIIILKSSFNFDRERVKWVNS